MLWTPEGADGTRPLIVMGHGGGQHKRAPSILDRALRFVAECGFAVVAVDAPSHGDRPDLSLGCGIGVPFVATESRVRAAVLGLGGAEASAETAARITVPVEFLMQWDDERVPRTQSLTLFDAMASAEKTLHANPGRHGDLPSFETDSSLRFFARQLG